MFRKSELIILIFIINGLFGQKSARDIGLGGSMVTLSRGVSAVGINPANLAYSRVPDTPSPQELERIRVGASASSVRITP